MWTVKTTPIDKVKYIAIAKYLDVDNKIFTYGPIEIIKSGLNDYVKNAHIALDLWQKGKQAIDINSIVTAALNK